MRIKIGNENIGMRMRKMKSQTYTLNLQNLYEFLIFKWGPEGPPKPAYEFLISKWGGEYRMYSFFFFSTKVIEY